jgi:hypothetical protein
VVSGAEVGGVGASSLSADRWGGGRDEDGIGFRYLGASVAENAAPGNAGFIGGQVNPPPPFLGTRGV